MPWIKDKVTGERKWFPSGGVSRETVQKMIDDAGGAGGCGALEPDRGGGVNGCTA